MKLFKTLALTGILAVAGTACADLDVTNLNDPDRERAISTPGDVEALISGAFQTWWGPTHYSFPGPALSTAADSHSSSWGNWGMRDSGNEPRNPYNNEPSYSNNNMAETPWGEYYAALAAVRDGLLAIEGGLQITSGGTNDTPRAVAFGKMMQGLSHGYLALLFDKGFVVDETSDLESLTFVPYTELMTAALGYLAEAEQMAGANSFTIPSNWVGDGQEWSSAYMQRFIRSYRARFLSQLGRTPAERDAAPWAQILADAQNGIQAGEDFGGQYNGDNWSWHRSKLHAAGISGWARIDYRTVGPADVSGSYAAWLAASPDGKSPFNIETTDTRITGGTAISDGSYIAYLGGSPFPASRGIYHYSNYIDSRWQVLSDAASYAGFYPDMTFKEGEFLIAEAKFRTGDFAGAAAIVNKYRANGGLPALTGAGANMVAPGGAASCVPRNDGSTCANLWEALKYEKRIELFHYGLGTEFFDDRGWGDLVSGTWTQLPIPGSELMLLLEDIYTFGGAGGTSSAPNIVTDLSPEALRTKRIAFERYHQARQADEGIDVIAH